MSDKMYPPKIAKLVTQSSSGVTKIVDFTDCLGFWNSEANELQLKLKDGLLTEGKIAINYTCSGKGDNVRCTHFLDVGVARVLFDDIVNYRFRTKKDSEGKTILREGTPTYINLVDEFKGGAGKSYGRKDMELCSSHLTVSYAPAIKDPHNSGVITIMFEQCPGVRKDKGQVMPSGTGQKLREFINIPISSIRPAAITALSYMQNRELMLLYRPFDVVNKGSDSEESSTTYVPE